MFWNNALHYAEDRVVVWASHHRVGNALTSIVGRVQQWISTSIAQTYRFLVPSYRRRHQRRRYRPVYPPLHISFYAFILHDYV